MPPGEVIRINWRRPTRLPLPRLPRRLNGRAWTCLLAFGHHSRHSPRPNLDRHQRHCRFRHNNHHNNNNNNNSNNNSSININKHNLVHISPISPISPINLISLAPLTPQCHTLTNRP